MQNETKEIWGICLRCFAQDVMLKEPGLCWVCSDEEKELTNSDGETAAQWLERQFEFEYCDECGGDTSDHDAVMVMGNWFARCKVPPAAEATWPRVSE